jgi:UPF0755 protein
MKKIIALIIFSAGIFVTVAAWKTIHFLSSPSQAVHQEIIFEIPHGMAFYHIANELEKRGLISDSRMFSFYAKFTHQTTHVQVGEYRLFTDMTPNEVIKIITSGQSISYQLTIPEGFNIYDIREELNKMWAGRGDEFFNLVTNPQYVKELTGENFDSLEGYLFPETYTLTKYTSTETLVRRMYDYFLENLKTINQNVKIKMPVNEQVILASVIEKETGAPGERQLISSVFHNRLSAGMRLQSDPTIIYGILRETNNLKKNITKADILAPNPYNTYTVKALPKGPISNPGRDALWAAVNPVDSKYLYFVSRNDGTQVFTESYKEHDGAVKKYQLDQKMRDGRSWRDLKKKK